MRTTLWYSCSSDLIVQQWMEKVVLLVVPINRDMTFSKIWYHQTRCYTGTQRVYPRTLTRWRMQSLSRVASNGPFSLTLKVKPSSRLLLTVYYYFTNWFAHYIFDYHLDIYDWLLYISTSPYHLMIGCFICLHLHITSWLAALYKYIFLSPHDRLLYILTSSYHLTIGCFI